MKDKLKKISDELDKAIAKNQPTEKIIPDFVSQAIVDRLSRQKA